VALKLFHFLGVSLNSDIIISTDDIHHITEDRVRLDSNSYQISAGGTLLKRLNEASRSYMYENFTTQPLSGDLPADALIDHQLGKVSGLIANIFDSYLDVSASRSYFQRVLMVSKAHTGLLKLASATSSEVVFLN
jgi:hypothetical protein